MNSYLTKSIKHLLLAGSTAFYTAGLFAAVGQQNPPPGPGQVPDYFGVVPNFANSPQPVLTKVTITDGQSTGGTGASATAALGAGGVIQTLALTSGGHNYVSPHVNIIDAAQGNGAVLAVSTTATPGVLSGFTITTPGSDCTVGDPVIITGAGSGVDATVSEVDINTGGVTAISFTNPGNGYTDGAGFSVTCTGTGAQNASGTIQVTGAGSGGITLVTVNQGGQKYSSAAQVIFTDLSRTNDGSLTDAVANVTVDANGSITAINVTEPGTGYSANTVATVQDVGTGNGATATVVSSGTQKIGGYQGVITQISLTNAGTNYHDPIVEITDAASTGGSGAVAVATTYDYANDIMTDKVMDVQVLNPGSGYDANTTVTVTGGNGATPVDLTAIVDNGAIVGFEEIPGASNPNPPANFTGLGSGFKTPLAGSGIRKFVDSLPTLNAANNLGQQLPVAVPDKASFPGSDYYEIEETEYSQKLHSDLPPTHLRGYRQLNVDINAHPEHIQNQYLGPVIVAQKDRPVRIKLVNHLSKSGDGSLMEGKLPIPVDTTYMGADGADDTDNRTALHLHGGNTPWISDGTPRQWMKPKGEKGNNKGESARDVPDMWFDANGNLINDPNCQGHTTCNVSGATNNPGDGALTFYYTNEQSARLMFYHDHAEGTTRLNVYVGMAAGYVLQDQTEQNLVNNGTIPPMSDTIPLVIQEKTFVPSNDSQYPVLNFYGPFRSAMNSQDPTWRWGTTGYNASGVISSGTQGNGDLWVPHVFMPNQNPGDVSGANSVGRWDYGAWFWPPFANLQNQPIDNPYYDPACNTTTSYCEGQKIPGVPNGSLQSVMSNGLPGGVADATHGGAITESPSGTPEAFNDTPLVNGTAYPYINVEPKKYRLRILSVGNDRMLNLSMVVAASKNSADTTADGNAGAANNSILCDGTNTVDPADCTETKMVPFTAAQNSAVPFPSHWYTKQKGGVTFDGRPSGVFDPRTRGPQMVQIGTEGGFLSSPVAIPNQPVNYEYNPKNILIGNIKEKALLLGPAERADVIVDFSNFAGSTIILYNDAGAPVPAWDLRLDYYTGNFDNTDTGGAFSVIPGYGPNSRTLMQFRVSGSGGSHPVDDLGSIDMAGLTSEVQTAFKTSQEPIIVPQSTYNATYGINATDALGQDLSRISDNQLSYFPLNTTAFPYSLVDTLNPANKVTLELEPKTIIEDWTMNWGRMNALLGTEVPHTTAINQTSIPQAFVDPPTDLVKITPNDNMVPISGTLPDGTQIWKITHNGVDSHAIHFHLFHVQIVNRVGWDGAVYPPDANELGWKDTVRMNPLSDTIVALRPMKMNLPFKVANSHRLLNPKLASGETSNEFFNFGPLSGNGSNVTNLEVNYGWEYLWHCHILGHEENDMMRSIAVAQPPEAPSGLTAAGNGTSVTLNWTDNSIISNWVTVQRALDSGFNTGVVTFNVPVTECNSQAGCARNYTDTTAPAATSVYYRIMANNTVGAGDGKLDAPRNPDGSYSASLPPELSSLTPGFTEYANVTANSDWSNTGARLALPNAVLSTNPVTTPVSLAFGNQNVGTTSAAKTVTLSNTGIGVLNISGIATSGAPFSRSGGSCPTAFPANLNPGANCTILVTFAPTSAVFSNGALTVTDNSGGNVGSAQTADLSGTGTTVVVTGPAAPTGVSVQRVSANSATVSWTDNSTNEASFQVQSSVNGGSTWSTVTTFTSTTAQRTGTGIRSSTITVANITNAVYRVVAVQTTPPTPALTTPSATPYASLNNTVVPAAPSNLAGSKACILVVCAVTLNWTDNSNNNVTFTLQRSTNNGGTYTNVSTTIAANTITFLQASLGAATNLYRIQAVNSVGSSAFSNTFTIVTP